MDSSLPLLSPLSRLEQADLIRRLQEPEAVYQFKHVLVQDSAYTSLLRNERRALHLACARALEQVYANALDEHAALLSQHYAEAGDDPKTFAYACRAGNAAFRVFAHNEALMHYDTAALLAARLNLPAQELVAVHQQRGRTLELIGRYDDAVEAYRALEILGQSRSDSRIELAALLALATLYTFPNSAQNLREALRTNQRALDLARRTGDEHAEARALWNRQLYAFFTGQANEAVAYSKQALAIANRLGLRELQAYILNDASRPLIATESVAAAMQALAEARVIWRETNNLPMLVDNLSSSSETSAIGGELEAAEDFAMQAQELSQTIGNVWNLSYSSANLLQIYAQRGQYGRALELYFQTIQLSRQSGFFVAGVIADISRAIVWGELGNLNPAIELLQAVPPVLSFPAMEGWRIGTLALLHMNKQDLVGARRSVEQARRVVQMDDLSTFGPIYVSLGAAELALYESRYEAVLSDTDPLLAQMHSLGIRSLVPDLLLRQARAHIGLGDLGAADLVLRRGEEVARGMQARPIWWQLLALHGALYQQQGDTAAAARLRQEARELIEWLAVETPADLRQSFLGQRHVQAVLVS